MRRFIVIFAIISFMKLFAQEEISKEFQEMSIEDLLNIRVVTASKQEEDINKAPAIIDVISSRQIEQFGNFSLYEILSYISGIEMIETFWGRTTLNFRGITNIHYNNKVLLMINGNPVFEPVLGSYILEQIPLQSIEKIEIIKGPGSSLYGTNAYSGVINILTKKVLESNRITLKASYASYNTISGNFSYENKISLETNLFLSTSYSETDGYPFRIKSDEKGNIAELKYKNKPFSVFSSFNHKGFTMNLGYLDMHRDHFGIAPIVSYSGTHHWKIFFSNFKYLFDISENATVTGFLRYLSYENPKTTLGYGYLGFNEREMYNQTSAKSYGAECQVNWKISDNLTNVSGLVHEYMVSQPYQFLWEDDNSISALTAFRGSHSASQYAGYTQFNFKITDRLNAIVGVRAFGDRDLGKIFFSPRAGIIYQITEIINLKMLFGNAYRNPFFFEKYVDTYNILFGKEDLFPERINTFDISIETKLNPSTRLAINGYYIETKDGIDRIPTLNPKEQGESALVYVNAAKYRYSGVELLLSGSFSDNLNYMINVNYKTGENQITNKQLYGFAPLTFNGLINYYIENFTLSVPFQFVGQREMESKRKGITQIGSYFLLNMNLSFNYNSTQIQLGLKNILNIDYSYPEFIRSLSEEIPGNPGLQFSCTIKTELKF